MTLFPDRRNPTWKMPMKGTWMLGRLSGFAPCCCAWFIIRSTLCNEVFGWGLQRKINGWLRGFEFYSQFNHVPCPCHLAAAVVGLYKPRYRECLWCDWMQQVRPGRETCGQCGRIL